MNPMKKAMNFLKNEGGQRSIRALINAAGDSLVNIIVIFVVIAALIYGVQDMGIINATFPEFFGTMTGLITTVVLMLLISILAAVGLNLTRG